MKRSGLQTPRLSCSGSTLPSPLPVTPSSPHNSKLQLFSDKAEELLRLHSALTEKRDFLQSELRTLSQKLAQSLKRREGLQTALKQQKTRKEEAIREYQSRTKILVGGERNAVDSQRLKWLLGQKQVTASRLRAALASAEKQSAVQDKAILAQAHSLSQKQATLSTSRDRLCSKNEQKDSLKKQIDTVNSENLQVEQRISEISCEICSVQAANTAIRTELTRTETSAAEKSTQIAQKEANSTAIQKELVVKAAKIAEFQREIARSQKKIAEAQARSLQLSQAEDEMQERVRQKLDDESKWKSRHLCEIKAIVDSMRKSKEKGA